MNYGFINLDNDADEVPLIIDLHHEDPGVEIKTKLVGITRRSQKFRVVATLEERVMNEFVSWCRYVEFDGDLAHLYLAKSEAVNEA